MVEAVVAQKKVLQKSTNRNDLLKLLAMVTMVVDHIGYIYFPNDMLLRIIGRLAFPIFAYQIATGYSRTSNLKKYVLRIFLFALMTQIPFSFFNPNFKFNPYHFNVLFTFVVGIGVLCLYDTGISRIKSFINVRKYIQLLYGLFLLILSIIIIVLPEVLSFMIKDFSLEYGMLALALILLFHIFEDKTIAAILAITVLYLLHGYYRVALYNSAYSSAIFWSNLFDYKYVWNQLDFKNGLTQFQRYYFNSWGVFALLPIFGLKNSNPGWLRLNKYVGYVFYPAHMTIIMVIAIIMKAR
ncbi:MAG: TraX family protein [Bacillota bacterium]|nr:TraX family protein [Bacillota bacterium]